MHRAMKQALLAPGCVHRNRKCTEILCTGESKQQGLKREFESVEKEKNKKAEFQDGK